MRKNPTSQTKTGTPRETSSNPTKPARGTTPHGSTLAGSLRGNSVTSNYPRTESAPKPRARGKEINQQRLRGYVHDEASTDPGDVALGNRTPMGPAAATIVPIQD